jgi:CIC family chloride channel protein
MFQPELFSTIIAYDILKRPLTVIESSDDMRAVMKKFDETQSWNLPVVNNGTYVGLISKSALFDAYRQKLIQHFGTE